MANGRVRVLARSDVAALLKPAECTAAVERAFLRLHAGEDPRPLTSSVMRADGVFHIKSAFMGGARPYFAAKCQANFPMNPDRHGLPTIQGALLLFDGADGRLLSVMDSTEITAQRTAAATALAVKHLARRDSAVVGICGCGVQGRVQLGYVASVLEVERVYAWDVRADAARLYAKEMTERLGTRIDVVASAGRASFQSDVVITCTPARQWILSERDVRPGTFVAGVGADNEAKQELKPSLLAKSRVVADVLEQACVMGDLHHAIEQGVMSASDVHAELGEVLSGVKSGRSSSDEIIVFDSTGMALQDVAVAAVVHEAAVRGVHGKEIALHS
jgi:ornithine cyclodeaminase/alanine dehydrogenase-like protein (mu-crystallin family)